jgi:hypothetical protein
MSKLHLYRCYSRSSAGSLSSGKSGVNSQHLSREQLFTELGLHIDPDNAVNKVSTALVSLTTSLARAIQLASVKLHKGEDEDDQIVIAFIKIPSYKKGLFHHAEALVRQARYLGLTGFEEKDPIRFRSEYLAEWEISPQLVTHTITLKTLLDRYPALELDLPVPNTEALREVIAEKKSPVA